MVNKTLEEQTQPGLMENRVLGCLLVDASCLEDSPGLDVDHFYSDRNRAVYLSIVRLLEAGTPVDAATVADDLAENGALTDAGGAQYLLELMESAPQLAHFDHYSKKVIERRRRSEIRRKLEQSLEALADGEDIETVIDGLDFSDDAISEKQFQWRTAAELNASEYQLEYFIENVFSKRQPMAIVAPQKANKTNIACDMAISLATGQPFLGKFRVTAPVNTAIFSCESGEPTLQETNRRVALSKGIPPSTIQNLYYCFDIPSLDSASDLRKIRRFIEQNEIQVLIIDPFYLTANLGQDAGNLFIVGEKLKALTKLMQETGCSIVLIHHTRKNTGQKEGAEPRMENIAYSGLPQWMRQWILIDRREPYDGDNPGSHKLWINIGGSAGHSLFFGLNIEEGSQNDSGGRRWEVEVIPATEARAQSRSAQEQQTDRRKDARLQADIKIIGKYLKDNGPNTQTKIRSATGIPPARIGQALFSMAEDGTVEECKVIKNSREYDGYTVTSSIGNSLVKTTDTLNTATLTHTPYKRGCVSVGESDPDCVYDETESDGLFDELNDIFPPDQNEFYQEG